MVNHNVTVKNRNSVLTDGVASKASHAEEPAGFYSYSSYCNSPISPSKQKEPFLPITSRLMTDFRALFSFLAATITHTLIHVLRWGPNTTRIYSILWFSMHRNLLPHFTVHLISLVVTIRHQEIIQEYKCLDTRGSVGLWAHNNDWVWAELIKYKCKIQSIYFCFSVFPKASQSIFVSCFSVKTEELEQIKETKHCENEGLDFTAFQLTESQRHQLHVVMSEDISHDLKLARMTIWLISPTGGWLMPWLQDGD